MYFCLEHLIVESDTKGQIIYNLQSVKCTLFYFKFTLAR